MRRALFSVGAVISVLTLSSLVHGQARPTTLNRYAASATPDDDFQLNRASGFGHLRVGAQLHLDYAYLPLVWEERSGESVDSYAPVRHQLNGTIGVSFGLFDRLVVFAGLPVVMAMHGPSEASVSSRGLTGADDPGLGDAVVGMRGRLVGEADDVAALAVQATLHTPTSGATGAHAYRGEDHVGFHGQLIGELRPGLGSRFVLNVGARLRDEHSGPRNVPVGHELTFGLGFAIPVWTDEGAPETHLDLHAQVYGATAFADAFGRENSPLEATGGARFFHASGFVVGGAAGAGLVPGIGSPAFRAVLTLGYASPDQSPRPVAVPDPISDRDGDGVPDDFDACPDEAGLSRLAGCPERAPEPAPAPEPVDPCESSPSAAGCPEADRDGDGTFDPADACPDEPGPAVTRGCPDPDRDGDGVPDRIDNCPDEPGSAEHQGCAAEQRVSLSADRLEIREPVYFATARATVLRQSHALLRNVAEVLRAHPEIEVIRVEGHSDARGSAERNRELSQQRAQAVVDFLVGEGVDASRLEARGFGADRPVRPDAASAEEHAENRRVEIHFGAAAAGGGR